jgi:uncharacterized membrane protein
MRLDHALMCRTLSLSVRAIAAALALSACASTATARAPGLAQPAVPAAPGDPAVPGEPALFPAPRMPLTGAVWTCGDGLIIRSRVLTYDYGVTLELPEGETTLRIAPAASGGRFESDSLMFWIRGNSAQFQRKPAAVQTCTEVRARSLIYDAKVRGMTVRAAGNEPSWLLEIDRFQRLYYSAGPGSKRETFKAQVRSEAGGTVYTAGTGGSTLSATVRLAPCTDSMSGSVSPLTVTLDLNGRRLTGCGTETSR